MVNEVIMVDGEDHLSKRIGGEYSGSKAGFARSRSRQTRPKDSEPKQVDTVPRISLQLGVTHHSSIEETEHTRTKGLSSILPG